MAKLPDDVVVSICERAGPRASARLSCLNHAFDRMTAEPHLWRGFQAQHLGPLPEVPTAAQTTQNAQGPRAFAHARQAFAAQVAAQVPEVACRNAARACLGDLNAHAIFLVAFPNESDTPRWCVEVLEQAAAKMQRPFRLFHAPRGPSEYRATTLGPRDFCVFTGVEAADPSAVQPMHALVKATQRNPGRKIALLHAADWDVCDGSLLSAVSHRLTYEAWPA